MAKAISGRVSMLRGEAQISRMTAASSSLIVTASGAYPYGRCAEECGRPSRARSSNASRNRREVSSRRAAGVCDLDPQKKPIIRIGQIPAVRLPVQRNIMLFR